MGSNRPDQPRYPLADLLQATKLDEGTLGQLVGLSGSSMKRAREWGLTADAADRYANRVGLHPSLIWPQWTDDQIAAASIACLECEGSFVPSRSTQIYCSKRCRQRRLQREWKRTRYQQDPAFAEATKAARREFYASCADYEKARERRRYHARKETAA